MNQVMFHTQEYRGDILTHPVFCEKRMPGSGLPIIYGQKKRMLSVGDIIL